MTKTALQTPPRSGCFNFISEGQAYYFVMGRLNSGAMIAEEDHGEVLNAYAQVVRFKIETYSTNAVIQEGYAKVMGFRQTTGTNQLDYSSKVWTLATGCGNVVGLSRLKCVYAAGVREAVRSQARSYLGNHRKV